MLLPPVSWESTATRPSLIATVVMAAAPVGVACSATVYRLNLAGRGKSGAGRENRTRLASLEGWSLASRPDLQIDWFLAPGWMGRAEVRPTCAIQAGKPGSCWMNLAGRA